MPRTPVMLPEVLPSFLVEPVAKTTTSKDETVQVVLFLHLGWYCAALCTASALAGIARLDHLLVIISCFGLLLATAPLFLVYIRCCPLHTATHLMVASLTCLVLCYDLHALVSGSHRVWPLLLIVIDVAASVEAVPTIRPILFAGAAWIATATCEEMFRFGLAALVSFDENESKRHAWCACADPPCAGAREGQGFEGFLLFGVIALYAAGIAGPHGRGQLQREEDTLRSCGLTVESFAKALSAFDLDAAEEVTFGGSKYLPPPLFLALTSIQESLRRYKPYLPQALFDQAHGEKEKVEDEGSCNDLLLARTAEPPGIESGKACIVFTDIQESTALWEDDPEGMKKALRQHNAAVRRCLTQAGGYEVKTIGDAFMAAFTTALDGCLFGLALQECLFKVKWPESILEQKQCTPVPGVWSGLRVRVGVHFGAVNTEMNKVIGRYDYFGQAVNKASRVEGQCIGGFVAVTEEVLAALGPSALGNTRIIGMGRRVLKGVAQEAELSLLVPVSLSGREVYAYRFLAENSVGLAGSPTTVGSPSACSIDSCETLELPFGEALRVATTAQVYVESNLGGEWGSSEKFNNKIPHILRCLERSEGAVVALLATNLVVGWNTTRPNTYHQLSALRFLDLVRETGRTSVHIGAATSKVSCGSVGDANHKFLSVVAPSITLGTLLVRIAERLNTFALYSAIGDLKDGVADSSGLRPLDADSRNLSLGTVWVFELSPVSCTSNVMFQRRDSSVNLGWGWTEEYAAAFANRDVETIKANSPHDPVLKTVVTLMENSWHIWHLIDADRTTSSRRLRSSKGWK